MRPQPRAAARTAPAAAQPGTQTRAAAATIHAAIARVHVPLHSERREGIAQAAPPVGEVDRGAHRAARVVGVERGAVEVRACVAGGDGRGDDGDGVVLALDDDFGDGEGGEIRDAREGVAVEMAPEAARPVHGVEEADDDAAVDLLFDALEAGAAAEEFVESVGVMLA